MKEVIRVSNMVTLLPMVIKSLRVTMTTMLWYTNSLIPLPKMSIIHTMEKKNIMLLQFILHMGLYIGPTQ